MLKHEGRVGGGIKLSLPQEKLPSKTPVLLRLSNLTTHEATRVPSLLYEISSIGLLVAILTCTKLLKNANT